MLVKQRLDLRVVDTQLLLELLHDSALKLLLAFVSVPADDHLGHGGRSADQVVQRLTVVRELDPFVRQGVPQARLFQSGLEVADPFGFQLATILVFLRAAVHEYRTSCHSLQFPLGECVTDDPHGFGVEHGP